MNTYDAESGGPRTDTKFYRAVYTTTYYLGAAVRRVVDFARFSRGRVPRTSPRRASKPAPPTASEAKIKETFSKIADLSSRLKSIEQSLYTQEPPERVEQRARKPNRNERIPIEREENVTAAVMNSLSDPDPGVREIAVRTLGELGLAEGETFILDALHDSAPAVRCAAAAAVAKMGSFTAVFSLILLLNDSELEVRKEAKAAVETITGERIEFDPRADSAVRKMQSAKLQEWWKEARFAKLSGELRSILKTEL